MLGLLRTFINIVLTLIECILSARFILLFFEIGHKSSFVAWIYSTSASIVAPFNGILAPFKVGGFVVDFTTLIALIVYGIVGGIILKLLSSNRY